jgi:hypothetical protein
VIADAREWLDGIEERYGPNFAIEVYGFLGAVGFTQEGDDAPDDESFSDSAVGFWSSDGRHWAGRIAAISALVRATDSEVCETRSVGRNARASKGGSRRLQAVPRTR